MMSATLQDQESLAGIVEVVDVHVGGDLHRVVVGGVIEPPGSSVMEKMQHIKQHADGLRKLLLHEPRGGHPSLFADLVVKPANPEADAGFIIMEMMGYPLISGTNTMSTAIALLETGILPMHEGQNRLRLEAPGGLIDVLVDCKKGKTRSVTYAANTPSYVAATDLVIDLPEYGKIRYDVVWTGAFYPIVDASSLGFELLREEEEELVRFARVFVRAVQSEARPVHPEFGDEGPFSFVVFAGKLGQGEAGDLECRVCCYEYPRNSVCRAPAGVPSTAVLSRFANRGQLEVNQRVRTVSIFGTDLRAHVTEAVDYHGYPGFKASVTGAGWVTARSQLLVDFTDALTPREGLASVLIPRT